MTSNVYAVLLMSTDLYFCKVGKAVCVRLSHDLFRQSPNFGLKMPKCNVLELTLLDTPVHLAQIVTCCQY